MVNTCCVTHEAVFEVPPGSGRAPRAPTERVYATGCGASLAGALDGLGSNVRVVSGPSEDLAGRRRG